MSVLNTQPGVVSEATPEATSRFAPTYRCRHLHTDGRQCGSPSLRQEHFCYYHHTTRVPAPKPPEHRSISDMEFDLPIPEDRIAVNYAIGEVLRRVAAMHIEHTTARILLYGLSVASANLTRHEKAQEKAAAQAKLAAASQTSAPAPIEAPVTDLVMDPHDGPLAPAAPGQLPSIGQRSITPGRLHLENRETLERRIQADWDRVEAAQKAERERQKAERERALNQPPEPTHPEIERILSLYTEPKPWEISTPRTDPPSPSPFCLSSPKGICCSPQTKESKEKVQT